MPDLDGTKTHENLKEAFAGESQANRRYLWFAQKADIEGYPDAAALFRSVAEGETGHAHGHLEYLAEVGDLLHLRVPFGGIRILNGTAFRVEPAEDQHGAGDRPIVRIVLRHCLLSSS